MPNPGCSTAKTIAQCPAFSYLKSTGEPLREVESIKTLLSLLKLARHDSKHSSFCPCCKSSLSHNQINSCFLTRNSLIPIPYLARQNLPLLLPSRSDANESCMQTLITDDEDDNLISIAFITGLPRSPCLIKTPILSSYS